MNNFDLPLLNRTYEIFRNMKAAHNILSNCSGHIILAAEINNMLESENFYQVNLSPDIQNENFCNDEKAVFSNSPDIAEIAGLSEKSYSNIARLRHSGTRGERPTIWHILIGMQPETNKLNEAFNLYGFTFMKENLGDRLVRVCVENKFSLRDIYIAGQISNNISWPKGFIPKLKSFSIRHDDRERAEKILNELEKAFNTPQKLHKRLYFIKNILANEKKLVHGTTQEILQDKSGLPDLKRALIDGYSINNITFYHLALTLCSMNNIKEFYELFGYYPLKDNFYDRVILACVKADYMNRFIQAVYDDITLDYLDAVKIFWYFGVILIKWTAKKEI